MTLNYRAIGIRIRMFRKSIRMTQIKLGELARVEPSNISHIERGATKVSLPTLVRLANALDVSLDELVCDSLNKNRHISVKEIDDLLFDCSDSELKAIAKLMQTAKTVLRER